VNERSQRLGDRSVWESAETDASAPQHVASAGRQLHEFLDKPRLADAGLAADEHDARIPTGDRLERPFERRELRLTADEAPAHERAHDVVEHSPLTRGVEICAYRCHAGTGRPRARRTAARKDRGEAGRSLLDRTSRRSAACRHASACMAMTIS
jgi:hypothetical protein